MPKRRKSAKNAKHHKSVADALLSEPTHPAITNFVVLQSLFDYRSSFKEVQQNRLVCKAWLQASNSTWKILTTSVVLYRDADSLNRLCPQQSENSSQSAESHATLEELWKNCRVDGKHTNINQLKKTIMARKFVLRNWNFDQSLINFIQDPSDLTSCLPTHEVFFWTQVAPSVVLDLCLDSCTFPSGFIPFPKNFVEAFPKLHRLQIKNYDVRMYTQSEKEAGMPRLSWMHLEDSKPGAFVHSNLTTLEISRDLKVIIVEPLIGLIKILPNLKRLKLHGINRLEENSLSEFLNSHFGHSLEELDLLDLSQMAHREGGISIHGQESALEKLKVLHHDIGFKTDYFGDLGKNYSKMTSLEELHLYRGIFSLPHENIHNVWNHILPNLRVLYLWGNLSDNLQFLRNFPNLKKLVWNTSCFDPKYFGKRSFTYLSETLDLSTLKRPKAFPLMDSDFTENTINAMGQLPILQSLEHLEIDWTLKSDNSWVILAKSMPNLVHLKVKTSGEHEMVLIKRLWKNLHTLELAHGSNLHPDGLSKGLNAFQKSQLRRFRLPRCPCSVYQGVNFNVMVERLNSLEGVKIGALVSSCEVYSTSKKESLNELVCLKAEYTKVFRTKNFHRYGTLLSYY